MSDVASVDEYLAVPIPRGPWFITQHDARALRADPNHTWQKVWRYWPILTPDGGVMMASTQDDAERIAATLNELRARVAELES